MVNNKMSEWVSCKERLPPAFKRVLLLHAYNNYIEIGEFVLRGFGFDRYKHEDVGYKTYEHINNISHWMPLPLPPK